MKTLSCAIALSLVASPAFATGRTPTPKPQPAQAISESSAAAVAGALANAVVGDVSATAEQTQSQSQEQSQTQRANAASAAYNYGNTLSYQEVRQAPSIAQGSLMVGTCGAGANGGGSNTSGAAFLGFAWTPAECHKYLVASNYAALGMYTMACQILNTTKAAKRTAEELGIPMPNCTFEESVKYVTEDRLKEVDAELRERQDREWERKQAEGK
jgi:hypothetical protein